MPLASPDVLFTVAEIAVALAGFSAVVVLFKRRDSGRWRAADADRFHGMVVHGVLHEGLDVVQAPPGDEARP